MAALPFAVAPDDGVQTLFQGLAAIIGSRRARNCDRVLVTNSFRFRKDGLKPYSSGATASRARIQARTDSGIGKVFCAV